MSELPADRLVPRSSQVPSPTPSEEVRAARREFERRVLRATLIAVAVVFVSLVGVLLAWRLREVLLLVVVSLFIAAVLHPIVSFVERRGLRRGSATAIVFALAVLFWAAIGTLLLHPVITAATHLVDELPKLIRQAEQGKGQIGHLVRRLHLLSFVESKQSNVQSLISRVGKPALSVGKSVIGGVVAVVTIFFLSFFLLLELPGIVRGLLDRTTVERSARLRTLIDDVGRAVVGYMLGNLATSIIAGIVVGITLLAMGVPYPAVLAVWVALVDFLPMIGGLLAGVPTVIIAALHSLPAGIVTLVVFLVYQQIENHVLNPIIMSRTVKLKALYVLLAVLLGAEIGNLIGSVFGGLVGALLSVPTASAIQVIARDLRAHRTGASILGIGPEGGAAPIADLEVPAGAGPVVVEAPDDLAEVRQTYGTGLGSRPAEERGAFVVVTNWARGLIKRRNGPESDDAPN